MSNKTIKKAAELMRQNKTASALSLIKKNIGQSTDTFMFFKGWHYYLMGDYNRAVKNWEEALQLNPTNTSALNYLTDTYLELGMIQEAEICARSAMLLSQKGVGNETLAYKLLVQTLFAKGTNKATDQDTLEEALDLLMHMVNEELDDKNESYKQIAATLLALHRFPLAERFAELALEADPTDPLTLRNLASIYTNQNKINEAINTLNRINGSSEQNIDAQYQKGMLQLLKGDYKNGWKNHEQRLYSETYSRKPLLDKFPQLSRYNENHYKHILVFQEQGIGDALMLGRYLPAFREFVSSVNPDCRIDLALNKNIFNARSSLKDFMQLNYNDVVDDFFEIDDLEKTYSSCISLFSLPYFLQIDVPPQTKFITDMSIPNIADGKKNIGLFWSGSEYNKFNDIRSMSDYHIRKLIKDTDANWIPLQLHHFPSSDFIKMPVDTITELAATIQTLDLVITVDTMVAHLAAGLGVETWVMLSYSPDWRWGLSDSENRWYHNTKLFRQEKWGDWDSVISKIKAELKT